MMTHRVGVSIICLLIGFLLRLPAQAAGSAVPWFHPAPAVTAHWSLTAQGHAPSMLRIAPRGKTNGKPYRLLAFFPKSSSAYDTALNEILTVLNAHRIAATVLVVNYELREEYGKIALREAERQRSDLIFAVGSESAEYLYRHYRHKTIPVVTVCAKDPVLQGLVPTYAGSGTNFAFTSLNVPVDIQMAYLQELIPGLRNIAILYDENNKSAVMTQVRPLLAAAKQRKISCIPVKVEREGRARAELQQKIPPAIATIRATDPTLQHSILWITGCTSVFREIATINRCAGKVPVISAVPDIVTEGDESAAISIGVSFESNAHLAAVYGIRILRRQTTAGALPVGIVNPPDIAINFKKTRQIRLRIPFHFFESATVIIDHQGRRVRDNGQRIVPDGGRQ